MKYAYGADGERIPGIREYTSSARKRLAGLAAGAAIAGGIALGFVENGSAHADAPAPAATVATAQAPQTHEAPVHAAQQANPDLSFGTELGLGIGLGAIVKLLSGQPH